jgi:hypothetical protein
MIRQRHVDRRLVLPLIDALEADLDDFTGAYRAEADRVLKALYVSRHSQEYPELSDEDYEFLKTYHGGMIQDNAY